MGTEAPPSDDEDRPDREDRLVEIWRRHFRRPYLVVALVAYLILMLLGLYASWAFWSSFGLDYLSYAGLGDYLLAPVTLLGLLFDLSFLVLLAIFVVILALVAGAGGFLLKMVSGSLGQGWFGRRREPKADVLPLDEDWQEQESFRAYLRSLATRPLWAAPIVLLAAILAINVDAAAEKRDLQSFARLIQHAYDKDPSQRTGARSARYELVTLRTVEPTARREHLVRLRSTGHYVLYYDVRAGEPLVVSVNAVGSEVAVAAGSPAGADDEPLGEPEETAEAEDSQATGGPFERAGSGRIVATPRAGSDGALSRGTDLTLQVPPAPAPKAVLPGATIAASDRAAPAGENGFATPDPGLQVVRAMDGTAGDDGDAGGARSARQPAASAAAQSGFAERPPGVAGSASPTPEFDAIDTNLQQSQGSLDGLKSSVVELEGTIAEIHKFIDELDGSLNQIDQAFSQLSELEAAADQLAYADCPDLTSGRPLTFEAEDAILSLEAVGWLFQSRRQLAARRSPERQEWLVIEGHGDGAFAAGPPLALQRAETVRDFLQSELGVPAEVVKVVGLSDPGPEGDLVSLYDCLGRQPAVAQPAPDTTGLGLVQSASAREVDEAGPVRPAAWVPDDEPGELTAMLADLEPEAQAGGLLVTVPGDRLFDTDSSRIRTSAYGVLGRIGEVLVRAPERSALIIGHSDAIGDAVYNRGLSEQRARAVRNFLVDRFDIGTGRLSIEGRGEDDPIATNDTVTGRLANRRIEVLLLD